METCISGIESAKTYTELDRRDRRFSVLEDKGFSHHRLYATFGTSVCVKLFLFAYFAFLRGNTQLRGMGDYWDYD